MIVRVPDVPARPFLDMLGHMRAVVREFALIRTGLETGTSTPDLPTELVKIIDRLLVQYDAEAELLRERAEDALAAGETTFVVEVDLPPEAADAVRVFVDTMDRIDEIAASGDVLLTTPSPPEMVTFRRWYASRVVESIEGGGRSAGN